MRLRSLGFLSLDGGGGEAGRCAMVRSRGR